MHKISLFILFCCLSIASRAGNKYIGYSTAAPSGTALYCYGSVSSSAYTENWGGCTNSVGTGGSVSYVWQLNGSNITGASGTFSVTASNYSGTLTLPAGTISSAMSAAGTYTLAVKYSWSTAGNPCLTGTSTITSAGLQITVDVLPTVSVSVSPSVFCYGSSGSVTLTATSSATNFSWQPNDGSITPVTSAVAIATPSANEVYTVTVTDGSSCTNSAVASVNLETLYLNPTATAICTGGTATLSASVQTSTYTSDNVTSTGYGWTNTDGATAVLNSCYPYTTSMCDNDNDAYATVDIGFTFYFYGIGYTTTNISANGYINFGAGSMNAAGNPLPDPPGSGDGTPTNLIALFMHDLDPDVPPITAGPDPSITYTTIGTMPNRTFIVSYYNVEDADLSGNVNTGQIILHEGTNNIDLMIGTCTELYDNATTVGIQNTSGTAAVYPSGENGTAFDASGSGEGWHFSGTAPTGSSVSYTWVPGGASTNTATATPTATTNFTLTASSAGCPQSQSAVTTVTVVPSPSVTAVTTSVPSVCSGGTLTLTATESGGTGNATYTWNGPGISTTTTSSPSLAISPTGSGDNYTVTVSYDGSGCTTSAPVVSSSVAVTTYTSQVWIGGTTGEPNDWNTPTNWGCGAVPLITDNVEIPSVTATNEPTLAFTGTGIGYANNLVLDNGASLTITGSDVLNIAGNFSVNATATVTMSSGATVNVGGNLFNNSAISGAGTLSLTASAPAITGNGQVSNLTLNNSTGATIGTTSGLSITGLLLLNAGTLTTNNKLILASYAAGSSTTTPTISGSIGTIPGTNTDPINGEVVVQQHFAGGSRAFRFIGHPFSTSVALSQIEPFIDITGSGGVSNGFTTTETNNPSSFGYNTLEGNSSIDNDPGWYAYTAIGQPIVQYQGIRLFVRGAKGQGLDGLPYTPDSVSYRVYGTVNTGTQTVPLAMATGSASVSGAYNLLSNPYPSVVDIGTVLDNAYTDGLLQGTAYFVWNPYLNPSGSGQFMTIEFGSGPYYLGANESFEVQTAGPSNSLTFYETNKTTNTPTDGLMRRSTGYVASLYLYDGADQLLDMLKVKFNEAASDSDDARYDAGKPPSPAEISFYTWSASHTRMSIDARPYKAGNVIPLGLMTKTAMPMMIKVNQLAVPNGGQVYLYDKLMGQYTLLVQGAEYKFSMDSSAAQADSRFELRMGPADVAGQQGSNGLDVQLSPNPAAREVNVVYTATEKVPTNVSIANVVGETVITQDLGTQESGSTIIPVSKLPAGVYMVTITSGNNKVVKRLVKE